MGKSTFPLALETPRLKIREFTTADTQSLYELESIPEVVRYQDWGPRTEEQAARVVENTVKAQTQSPRHIVELAVVLKDDDTFIARIGGQINHETRRADLWFVFMPSAQGKGYATEAMENFIPVLVEVFELKRCEIECDPRNTGSWRLAERLGFEKVKEVDKAYESKGEWVGSKVYAKDFKAGSI